MEAPMLAIRLPEDIEGRLTALAAKTGRTKTFYAREAILEHLDDMEDKYLAINRLENPGKRWTLDEMEQDVDLDS
jgi:RHH-type rel operon transcriptional repressor/antitoxin RelB